jgi:hypothetical protein
MLALSVTGEMPEGDSESDAGVCAKPTPAITEFGGLVYAMVYSPRYCF